MQCLHLGQLVGREHLGIGKEELKLSSRFHFHQPIFLQFMEKLESCEEVVLVQQEVYHTVAEMVLGAVVVVVRHSYHHACCCCGVFFRHRRRLLPLSLLCLSAPCFLVSNGKRTNQYILTSKGTFYTRVPAQRISCPTSLAHSHCSFFLGPTT